MKEITKMCHGHSSPVPDEYLETVEHHNRIFQKYSLQNGIYFAPVDEVLAPKNVSNPKSSFR